MLTPQPPRKMDSAWDPVRGTQLKRENLNVNNWWWSITRVSLGDGRDRWSPTGIYINFERAGLLSSQLLKARDADCVWRGCLMETSAFYYCWKYIQMFLTSVWSWNSASRAQSLTLGGCCILWNWSLAKYTGCNLLWGKCHSLVTFGTNLKTKGNYGLFLYLS